MRTDRAKPRPHPTGFQPATGAKPAPRPLWLYLTEPGLGPLLANELKFLGAVERKAQFAKLHLRNHDLLVLPDVAVKKREAKPRLATNVLAAPVFGRASVSPRQLDYLAEAFRTERAGGIANAVAGETFARVDFLPWIGRELRARNIRIPEEPSRVMWFIAVDDKFYFGFPRFNHHDAAGRVPGREREGSLPPVVGAAMVFAAKPGTNEVILDPVMGTGTILAEAAAMAPDAALIGSDIDREAVETARRNLARVKNAKVFQRDSTNAPFERSDLTLTIGNLPFGKQHKSAGGNRALYEALLRRSLAHAASNWRAVLLTSDDEALEGAVGAIDGLACTRVAGIKVRGQPATIWSVTRSGA
jgi:precorrin-6B methylase 2